jgi:phosphoenolpyruvate-protein kinase (PTS system EI component)
MKGIAVSKGVAIGKAYLLDSTKFCIIKHQVSEPEAEKRLNDFAKPLKKPSSK